MNFILEYEKFIILSKNIEFCSEPTLMPFNGILEEFRQEYLNDEEVFYRCKKMVDFNQDADDINSDLQYYYECTAFNGIYDNIEDFEDALLNNDIRRINIVCFIDTSKFGINDNTDIVYNKIKTMSYEEIRSKYMHSMWLFYYDNGYIEKYEGYKDAFDIGSSDDGFDCYRYQDSDMDKNIEYYKIGALIRFRDEYRIYDGIILDNNEYKDYFTMNYGINRSYDVMFAEKENTKNIYIHHDDIIEAGEIDLDLLEYKVHHCMWPFNEDYIQFITNYIKSIKESEE